MRVPPWVVFFGYIGLSWFLNGLFPFSRYSMYSKTFTQTISVTLLSGDIAVDFRDYTDFFGDVDDLALARKIYGDRCHYISPHLGYFSLEHIMRYLSEHAVSGAAPPGSAQLEFVLHRLRRDSNTSQILVSRDVLWRGTARKK